MTHMSAERSRDPLLRAWLLVVVGLCSACSDSPAGPTPSGLVTELPRSLSLVEENLLRASNAFAFQLARELVPVEADENLFFSPLSVSMVLGMLLNGADGDTFDQIRSVLGFGGLTQEQINQGYADLTALLVGLDPGVTIEIANSVWPKAGFPVLADFSERIRSSFGAESAALDFADPNSLDRINGWADEATHGLIEKIFDELPGNVVMVLLNAIYFEAGWSTRFDPGRTATAPFFRTDGSIVTSDLMLLERIELPVLWEEEATLVELPYGGEAFAMTVVLPGEGTALTDVVAGLSAQSWNSWTENLAQGKVIVRLPRFELGWEAELNDPLRALGIADAFEPGLADFTRLTPGGGVWLDLVKQKAFVSVDEEGTRAAAVTGAVLTDSAPVPIRMDRPFLFVLRERLTGAILFMGVVNDPTSGA